MLLQLIPHITWETLLEALPIWLGLCTVAALFFAVKPIHVSKGVLATILFVLLIVPVFLAHDRNNIVHSPPDYNEDNSLPGAVSFQWDHQYFDGANLHIYIYDGEALSSDAIDLCLGRPDEALTSICRGPSNSIWVEIHPVSSYEVGAFYDDGDNLLRVATAYTGFPDNQRGDRMQEAHIYLP